MSRISGDKLLVESRLLGRDATVQAHSAHVNKDDDVVRYYAAILDPVTPPFRLYSFRAYTDCVQPYR